MRRRGRTRILLYPHSARAFASALIGHLYELAQQHDVVLLAEPLPQPYLDLLGRRDLFPGLEKIQIVSGLGFTVPELVGHSRRWQRTAEDAIAAFTPDLVVTENDMSSLFEMYLLRAAKRRGIRRLTIQGLGQVRDVDNQLFIELLHVYRGGLAPSPLAARWRRLRHRSRKQLGHVLVHYLLPWTSLQPAFHGESSYVTFAGAPGMRDSELHLVQSRAQYDAFLESRVRPERLAILDHPLIRVPREAFFPRASASTSQGDKRMLILMSACGFGFRKESAALIPAVDRRALRLAILAEIRRALPDWTLLLKAHPDIGSRDRVQTYLGALASDVIVVDPSEAVEPLLPSVAAVLDLPAPWTSTLVTAASAFSDRPVIAADLDQDLVGDVYSDWPDIEYVTTMAALVDLLGRIRSGTYTRKRVGRDETVAVRRFDTTTEAAMALLDTATR